MKYILILLVSFAFGQTPNMTYIDGQWYGAEELKEKEMQEIKEYLFGTEMPIGIPMPIGGKDLWYIDDNGITSKVITRGDILEYAEECYKDTLIFDELIKSEQNTKILKDRFDIHTSINNASIFSDILESNGYGIIKYKSGFVYYVKKPTLEGFIEWIKK